MDNIHDGSAGRMSPAPIPATKAKISDKSLPRSQKSRMKPMLFLCLKRTNGSQQAKSWETVSPSPGVLLTCNFGESPSEGVAVTLSQILQTNVPEKYYSSSNACQGILRRASARGKELPEVLRIALETQAAARF